MGILSWAHSIEVNKNLKKSLKDALLIFLKSSTIFLDIESGIVLKKKTLLSGFKIFLANKGITNYLVSLLITEFLFSYSTIVLAHTYT